MDINKINEERHEVLEGISKDLENEMVASVLRTATDDENSPEILTVDFDELGLGHDSVLGEFYFYPVTSDEDTVGLFSSVLTVAEEIPEENLPAVYEAISVLNFHILTGAFGVSKDRRFLAYKQCVTYSLDMTKEELRKHVDITMGNVVSTVDQWVDMVIRISEGEGSVEDVLDALG